MSLLSLLAFLCPVLAQASGQLFPLSPTVGRDVEVPASSGDTLYSVARSHGLAIEHLAFANGLPVSLSPVTRKSLLVPRRRILPASPPQDGLVLNLPERGVFLFREGQYRGFFPVAIGRIGWETPTGDFKIADKAVDPIWFPPAWAGIDYPVMPGPQNPLGDRWIGLSRRGYGIHSTNQPDSIGGALSHGCIRSYPEHARQLYDQVQVGMPVRIEYRPVKLGRDPETGRIEMAVFPDVYRRVNLESEAQKILSRHDLQALLEFDTVKAVVAGRRGVVTPVFGERIVLNTGTTTAEYTGFVKQGRLYLGSSALANYSSSLPPERVIRVNEKDFMPVAEVLSRSNVPFRWEGATRTLYLRVEDGADEVNREPGTH